MSKRFNITVGSPFVLDAKRHRLLEVYDSETKEMLGVPIHVNEMDDPFLERLKLKLQEIADESSE